MKFRVAAVICIAFLSTPLIGLAQNRNTARNDQVAITEDGKRVLLKSNKTWKYISQRSENVIILPVTRRTETLEISLLDVYKAMEFAVPPPSLGGEWRTETPREGNEFVVVRFNVRSLKSGASVSSSTLRMYDMGGNLCNQLEVGKSTDNWTEIPFELPFGRQAKTIFISDESFNLTKVGVKKDKKK